MATCFLLKKSFYAIINKPHPDSNDMAYKVLGDFSESVLRCV